LSFELTSVLGRWTPPPTFKIELGGGDELEFKSCGSYSEYRSLERSAGQWAADFQAYPGSKAAGLAPFKDWVHLPTSQEEAVAAFIISELSVEPKLGIGDACALLKAPLLVDFLLKSIRIAHRDASMMSLSAGVDAEKKDLEEMETPPD
jgi:hypothetical protein